MTLQILDSLDPLFILVFLSSSQLACESNAVHKTASFWFLINFLSRPADATLNPGIAFEFKLHKRQKEGSVASYCEAVTWFWRQELLTK